MWWPHTCPFDSNLGVIPPKSLTKNKSIMFATTKGIGSLVPTTIVHWLKLWGHSLFFHPYKDIGCLTFGTHKDNVNPKNKRFSRHSNILTLLSHTSHFTRRKLKTPNRFQLSSLQTTYTSLMTIFFPIFKYLTTLVALTHYIYIYIYINAEIFWNYFFLKTMFVIFKMKNLVRIF